MFSVITGDILKSSAFKEKRKGLLHILYTIFDELKQKSKRGFDIWISDIFRGDSFQIIISEARYALMIAIYLRARLLQESIEGVSFDARIAIGIGNIEYFIKEKVTESDGEAFRLSGRSIEEIPNYRRLIIKSSNESLNRILDVISAFLDAVALRWSSEQAEAISHWIFGERQITLARKIGVSQSAIQQRLQLAGHFAIETCLKHYDAIIEDYRPGS